jgi:predicted amidophosphoribosyltransferase
VFPDRCAGCGKTGGIVCDACRAALRPVHAPWCDRCGAPTAWPVSRCRECSGRRLSFATARAAVAYVPPVPALVRGWKERGLHRLAAPAAELVARLLEQPAADVITYIPPDPLRQLTRSTHPAEALAHRLGGHWQLAVEPLLTRRAAGSTRQAGLRRAARLANVRQAFAASGTAPDRVVLVDDVYTTGATATAAAAALRRAGASRVEVVTFARAVR